MTDPKQQALARLDDDVDFMDLEQVAQPGSVKENKDYVTPYAFGVPHGLIGTPLARPKKRLFALIIDLIVVAMLTQVSGFVLAGLLAWIFIRVANDMKRKGKYGISRKFLRVAGIICMVVCIAGVVQYVTGGGEPEQDNDARPIASTDIEAEDFGMSNVVSGLSVAAMAFNAQDKAEELAEMAEQGECELTQCWLQHLSQAGAAIQQVSPEADPGETLLDIYQEHVIGLSDDEFADIVNQAAASLTGQATPTELAAAEENQQSQPQIAGLAEQGTTQSNLEPAPETSDDADQEVSPAPNAEAQTDNAGTATGPDPFVQVQQIFQRIVADMGTDFGWMAMYFTVLTGWFGGQTIGKRLLGIRVIKLNGSDLNLWESFGRYGGYVAGLATGLMGFLQVFWDANRQCIHDKIAETLVIDLNRPSVDLSQE